MTEETRHELRLSFLRLAEQGGGWMIGGVVIYFVFQSFLPAMIEQNRQLNDSNVKLAAQLDAAERNFISELQRIDDVREEQVVEFTETLAEIVGKLDFVIEEIERDRKEFEGKFDKLLP